MKATVLVTHLDDARVERAIASALSQGPLLHQLLVADGGSTPDLLASMSRRFGNDPRFKILPVPGSVAESRNQALDHVRSEILAFLDSDEVAPPGWLERITKPIRDGHAEFTGGPTKPLANPKSGAERYVDAEDARLYASVPNDLALLPMGNSAWRTELLRKVGGFDPRLGWGGEDYDVNLRALRSGARGTFVPEAWVHHDQSHLDSFAKVLRRKRQYYFGATTAYLKNDAMGRRATASLKRFRVRHALDLLDPLLKGWAVWQAHRYFRRAFGRPRFR